MGAAPRQRGKSDAWMLTLPSGGDFEHRGRQNEAIGHHDQHVRAPTHKLVQRRIIGKRRRLRYRKRSGERRRLHGACAHALAATARGVRSREYTDDFVARREQRLQCGAGELGRSCECNAQCAHVKGGLTGVGQ